MLKKKMLNNKVVMITGGTGSLGYKLTEIFLKHFSLKVDYFSRDELKQSEHQKNLIL